MKLTESTQVSAKYDPENASLFAMTKRLRSLGVTLVFPRTDTVIEYPHEFAITHPQERSRPFHLTQIDFFRSIRENPYHIIFNRYMNKGTQREGYLGESASIELLYALAHNKPVLCLTPEFSFGDRVNPRVAELINNKKSLFRYTDLEQLSDSALHTTLNSMTHTHVNYNLSDTERQLVLSCIRALCNSYRNTWRTYTAEP